MKAVVQRVTEGRVLVGGQVVGRVGEGLVVLLGIARGDGPAQAEKLAARIIRARVFAGEGGHFHHSLEETGGGLLVVSQFTLCARTGKGRRPSFDEAAPPEEAQPLYEHFLAWLREAGVPVESGVFGASMVVELANQGPVTLLYEA